MNKSKIVKGKMNILCGFLLENLNDDALSLCR